MTEPTDPKKGAEQPSQQNPEEPGIFRPAPSMEVRKIQVDGVHHPGTLTNKETEREKFILALSTKVLVAYGVEKGRIDSLLKDPNFKTLDLDVQTLQRQKIEKELAVFYQEIEQALVDTSTSHDFIILFSTFEEKLINLQISARELDTVIVENSIQKIAEHKSFIPCIGKLKELEQRINDKALEDKDIFDVYNSLSSLSGAFDPFEFKKEITVNDAEASLIRLEALLDEFEAVTVSESSEGKEAQNQQEATLEDSAHLAIQAAESYTATAQGTKVVREINKKIQNLKNKLAKKNKSDADIELISDLTQKLTDALEEAKQEPKPQRDDSADIYGSEESRNRIAQIKLPTPLLSNNTTTPPQQTPTTSTPTVTPTAQTQATQEPRDPAMTGSGFEPGNIIVPYISKDDQANIYRVSINGNVSEIPLIIMETLLKYRRNFRQGNGEGYENATDLKNKILTAIQVGDFVFADKQAQDLGAELNSITRRAVDPVINTDSTNTSSPIPNSSSQQQQKVPPATAQAPELKRTADDIFLPEISLNPRARTDENKYKIKIDGKWETVPQEHWETLNNFKAMFDNVEYSEKDFTLAISLKDAVLEALRAGNLAEADKQARALGAELNSFINEKAEEEPSADEDPDAYKGRGFWNTRVSTFSLDGTKNWSIKKGDAYVKMSDQELAAWLPINSILTGYSSFVNSPDQAHSFPSLVKQKNEILDALEAADFRLATELAKKLAKEFDPMLDKENIPAQEKTAARIQHEVRQYNLAQLANKDNFVLDDNTSRFAFIKDPQSTTKREYRIINKDTGEWVPLTKKDLTIVELAQSALTHFRNQTSKSPESIQKKNEILAHINDYDFQGAKIAAEEYLAYFSGIKRSSPLRPTVSGPKPSPALEKSNLTKIFALEKEKLLLTEELLMKRLPLLTSDLEKAAFTRLLEELKKLEVTISENPTRESVELFKAKNERLLGELATKEAFFEKQFGKKVGGIPTVQLNENTTVMRSARLRGTDDAKETLGERSVRLKREEGSADIAQTRALNNKAELFEIHKKMFEENPTEYRNIYANKNKVRDSLTEDISTHTLADIDTPSAQEEVARKTFLKSLVGLSPQEYLKELAVRKHDTMKKKQELVLNNLNGITLENYDVVLGELDAQLALIQGKEKKYTAAILSKFTKTEVAPKPTLRQVYRPSQDDSLGDTTRGLGRNFEVNENNEVVKINRENLTQEQIETDFANEVNPNDSQAIRPLQEKINLADSPHSNHTKGMSPLFNEEEDESPQHAFSNEDIEKVRKEIEEEQATKKLQEEQESKERANEKLVRGGKLFDSLVKKIKPTTSRQWLLLALTSLGLSAGAGVAFGKEGKNNGPEDKRLIDEYKKQPGWKNYLAEKVSEGFLKDFNGEGKLDYKELIVKYAPSFNINPNNPSAGDKLSSLLCKDVYFVIGANAGINEKQQIESSMLIDNLKEIMIAAKASLGTLYSEEAIQSGAIFGDMTIQQYYDVVRKEVENADSERARLQAIKR